jgi:hypothetical protein
MELIGNKPNKIFLWLFPYLTLVLVHIVLGLSMQQPNIWDEFGYLARARYLSGVAHIPQDIGRYHFGYSLFLLPAFWLFSDPISVYRAAIITNSLLMSSLYFAIYYILNTLFQCEKRISLVISFACCLYPAFVLQSNLVWSENAFVPFFSFFIVSFAVLLKRQSYTIALGFGFITGFLFTIHPRALPVLPMVVIYLIILGWLKTLPRPKVLLGIAVIVIVFVFTRSINDHLFSFDARTTVDSSIKTYLYRLLSASNLMSLTLKAAGQLLYLMQATYGLFLIGIAYLGITIWQKWSKSHVKAFNDIPFNIMVLVILSSSGIFFASSLQMIHGIRGDHLIYGRYNEGFLAFYIAVALIAIRSGAIGRPFKVSSPYIISLAIMMLTLIVLSGYDYGKLREMCKVTNVNVINVLCIYPFIGILRRLDIFINSLISILLLFILLYSFRIRFVFGIWLLIIYFVTISACGYTVYYVRSENIKQVTTLASHIRSLGNIETVSYDTSFYDPESWLSYQYLLPDVVFKKFSSFHNQLPTSKVVISGRNWKDSEQLNARFVASENPTPQVPYVIRKLIEIFFEKPLRIGYHRNQTLWVLPGKG